MKWVKSLPILHHNYQVDSESKNMGLSMMIKENISNNTCRTIILMSVSKKEES